MDEHSFVVCVICKKKLRLISGQHLRTHNVSITEYRQRFPGAETAPLSFRRNLSEIAKRKDTAANLNTPDVKKKVAAALTGQKKPYQLLLIGKRRPDSKVVLKFTLTSDQLVCGGCANKFSTRKSLARHAHFLPKCKEAYARLVYQMEQEAEQSLEKHGVRCLICHRMFWNLSGHLKAHGVSTLEYRQRFPSADLVSGSAKINQAVGLRSRLRVHPRAYKQTPARMAAMEAKRGRPIPWLHTEEIRRKISESLKAFYMEHPGRASARQTRAWQNPERKVRAAPRMAEMRAKQALNEPTFPEDVIARTLFGLGIRFSKQVRVPGVQGRYFFHCVDFLIEEARVAIEVDGCYWHHCQVCFPEMEPRQKDLIISRMIRRAGWTLLRLWEHDVRHRKTAKLDRVKQLLLQCEPLSRLIQTLQKSSATSVRRRGIF